MRVTEKRSIDNKRCFLFKWRKEGEREKERDCGVFFNVMFASLAIVRVSNE